MATVALLLASERWLDEILLQGSRTDVGADVVDTYTLPAGIGDIAIMEIYVNVSSVATPVALTNLGIEATVRSASTAIVDFIGVYQWFATGATRRGAYLSPDPLVLVRQNETIGLAYPELDSNGAPTDDHFVFIKAVRVRPVETAGGAPLQLVR